MSIRIVIRNYQYFPYYFFLVSDFILDTNQKPPRESLRKKGTVLVFPSFMRHKVEPVTKGIRKSLVAWIEGPHWR